MSPGVELALRLEEAEQLAHLAKRVDRRLSELLPPVDEPPRSVHRAMRYALMGAGKRLRPVCTLAVGAMFGAPPEPTLDLACAVEMIHACSLVLDDLPAMDDAALRRGRPTVHRVFSDSVALLASYGLLNRAFALVAESARALPLEHHTAADLVTCVTAAIGSEGLIGGQALDLESRNGTPLDQAAVTTIHRRKTGALFTAAAELGALAADVGAEELRVVRRFAGGLGLAFQVADDLLDALAAAEEAGKDVGQDAGRASFVGLLGVDGARRFAGEVLDEADLILLPLGSRARLLQELTGLVRHQVR